ncbi:hypothetical protein JHK87_025133 [Glycine soja]|nr:hypothetical protein JHK87_025133 [Glycine soja]
MNELCGSASLFGNVVFPSLATQQLQGRQAARDIMSQQGHGFLFANFYFLSLLIESTLIARGPSVNAHSDDNNPNNVSSEKKSTEDSCITFVKSVDTSDVVKDAKTLCNLFCERYNKRLGRGLKNWSFTLSMTTSLNASGLLSPRSLAFCKKSPWKPAIMCKRAPNDLVHGDDNLDTMEFQADTGDVSGSMASTNEDNRKVENLLDCEMMAMDRCTLVYDQVKLS